MKHFSKFAILAVAAVFFSTVPAARADAMYGDLSVTVWNGAGVDYTASLPTPTSTPTATFNYSGPLNFVNNSGQNTANTFLDFFNSNGSTSYTSDISNFHSSSVTWSQFLNLSMSTPGYNTNPSAINTYMSFAGTYLANGPTAVTISHDDGASLYYKDGQSGNWITAVSSAAPTSDTATKGTLIEGTSVPFDLTYVEANGAPADLGLSGLSPVPESSTIVLMSLGLIGIFGLMYRRQVWNS